MDNPSTDSCRHCGGRIAIRNPTGECDHMFWPDMLTDDARRVNGYVLVEAAQRRWQKPSQQVADLSDF